MKFHIQRDHFSTGLQQVLNVVSSRATMPILANVLIQAQDGELMLTTTNLDMGIRCHIRAKVTENGSVTLPVRKLANIIKSLPSMDVTVETTPNHQAKITSGGSIFKIMGMGVEDFPALPEFRDPHSLTLNQNDLLHMLRSVAYAQSNDENRHVLNGVYFNLDNNKFSLVATDGRRLAMFSRDLEESKNHHGSLIVPAKTVAELQRLLDQGDKVTLTFNDRQIAFEIQVGKEQEEKSGLVNNLYLVSKVVEGQFPNYKQVIPQETGHRVKLERELFHECLSRAALVTSEKNNSVRLKVSKNTLEINGFSPDVGESHESMAIAYEGPEVQVAFNPQFLLDPLKALTKDEVYFEFNDQFSPGLIKTLESFLCVVMPLRLN